MKPQFQLRSASFLLIAAIFLLSATMVNAQVGEPFGTYSIKITQGATVRMSNSAVVVPPDIKTTAQDGDPEDFVVVGHLPFNAPDPTKPVIIKLTSDGGPSESFRILHFYLDVPATGPGNTIVLTQPGPTSLLDPANPAPLTIEISGLKFLGTAGTSPLLVDNLSYFATYMLDQNGRFYYLTNANAFNSFGHGAIDIQIPGHQYLDGIPSPYNFLSACGGTHAAWKWDNLINPGPATPVALAINNGTPVASSTGGTVAGYVFELGLSVAFVAQQPISLASVPDFVSVILGQSLANPTCLYDFNLDGVVDSQDIPGFIDALLNP